MIKTNKIKKKWLSWRLYKRFFIWKKKINFFTRFKLFFTYSKIIKKYLIKTYSFKNSKALRNIYLKSLKITNNKTYDFLYKLELRLDLILIRIYFIKNVKSLRQLIKNDRIIINNKIIKYKNYNIKIYDKLCFNINNFYNPKKVLKIWKKKKKFRYQFLFKCKVKNFLEINYKIAMFICVKLFWSNEFMKKKRIKLLDFKLFQKYWAFN